MTAILQWRRHLKHEIPVRFLLPMTEDVQISQDVKAALRYRSFFGGNLFH
jgi:hypothetical protein